MIEPIFGTWPLTSTAARDAVTMALDLGYRRIDTAQWYDNEAEVGVALRTAGDTGEPVRVTTKVMPDNLHPNQFLPSVRESLDRLGLERIDLLLMHWPPKAQDAFDVALDGLNAALAEGLADQIGISNCTTVQMRRAAARSEASIAVNQVEFHPLIDQRKVQAVAAELGIALEGYCSLGRGEALGQEVTEAIAAAHGVAEAQVVLAWALAERVAPVTMSTKRPNAAANLAAGEVTLTADEIARIGAQRSRHLRVVSIPELEPDWDHP